MEQNKQPLLSICIPTYNRKEEIQKQIKLILPQLTEEVKLIVYDNHSDIPVKSLFNDEELQHFTIIRNNVNIGGDANIARCFEYCTTTWLWTLSDDDFIKEDGIKKILQYIKANPNATFINTWSPIECITENVNDFLRILSDREVFSAAFAMSTCIYNMDKLKYDLYFYYKNLSSMLGTLIMLIRHILKNNGKCIWINNPQVHLNSDVGWNYREFIYRSFLLIQEFNETKEYNKNLFLGLYRTDYTLIYINRSSSHLNWIDRLQLLYNVSMKQGILNALKYSPKEYFKCLATLFLGPMKRIFK